jgi:hypothetical protein
MVTPMNADAQEAVNLLAQYRLDTNITFRDLANEMRKKGWYVPARSLHLALTHRVVPVDRTQHRIKRFVDALGLRDDPSTKKRRASSAA